MKPLLYHLEYHIQDGYFEGLPKGQVIKMLVGSDGGVQTLYGRATGTGTVLFSSGKSVLFAMDQLRNTAKVVFRVYKEDVFIGEAVKVFKGDTFPKRSLSEEPASYTFGADLGFRKDGELVGATKAFIRMTSFGENIISECIKDGESYRVRMTSLIVERNKDPRKNVKPWWVVLDGRRLRFSKWLRALEKEDCTKEVYLKVKKNSEEKIVQSSNSDQEENTFIESAEASLRKEFNLIYEYGNPETEDKGSQVSLGLQHSISDISAIPLDIISNLQFESRLSNENNYSLYCLDKELTTFNLMKKDLKGLFSETGLSMDILQPGSSHNLEINVNRDHEILLEEGNKQILNEEYYTNSPKTDIISNEDDNEKNANKESVEDIEKCKVTGVKSDDIFHFEASTSDITGEIISENDNASTIISSFFEKCTNEVTELGTVTDKSFLAEAIVREIIDLFLERLFEAEYNNSLQRRIAADVVALKEESACRISPHDEGYGDTESSMELSDLGITETTACIELSTVATHASKNDDSVLELAISGDNDNPEERAILKTKENTGWNDSKNTNSNLFETEFISGNEKVTNMVDPTSDIQPEYTITDLIKDFYPGKLNRERNNVASASTMNLQDSFLVNINDSKEKEDDISSRLPLLRNEEYSKIAEDTLDSSLSSIRVESKEEMVLKCDISEHEVANDLSDGEHILNQPSSTKPSHLGCGGTGEKSLFDLLNMEEPSSVVNESSLDMLVAEQSLSYLIKKIQPVESMEDLVPCSSIGNEDVTVSSHETRAEVAGESKAAEELDSW